MRVALGLSYDGAAFHGWQVQAGCASVQGCVEQALASFLGHATRVVCAGRTDTGVHALDQVVHLDTPAQRSAYAWLRGLNALLPSSVAVQWAQPVADDFHARFSAQGRHYIYVITTTPQRSPFWHGRAAWVYRSLDVDAMRRAARALLGEHDFSSFRSSQCQAHSPVRQLHALDIAVRGPCIVLYFHGNAFLHHMVRNIVGSLVYVGLGRQPEIWLGEVLALRDRRQAAPTFSAAGLYLAGVDYAAGTGLPSMDLRNAMQALTGFDPGPLSGQAPHS